MPALPRTLPGWWVAGTAIPDIRDANPDAEFILEPHEADDVWRRCVVGAATLAALVPGGVVGLQARMVAAGDSPADASARVARVRTWIAEHPTVADALAASPPLATLDARTGRLALLDGAHRLAIALAAHGAAALPVDVALLATAMADA